MSLSMVLSSNCDGKKGFITFRFLHSCTFLSILILILFSTQYHCVASESSEKKSIEDFLEQDYKYGETFHAEVKKVILGLSISSIEEISKVRSEPPWMLEFRLKSYHHWKTLTPPAWANVEYNLVNTDEMILFSDLQVHSQDQSDALHPEIQKAFQSYGVNLSDISTASHSQNGVPHSLLLPNLSTSPSLPMPSSSPLSSSERGAQRQEKTRPVAMDVILDSTSIYTSHYEELKAKGILFLSLAEAIKEYPDLVREYLATVVPVEDNYFAALNSAVFSDGTFVYVKAGVSCHVDLSSYFRINTKRLGQFERTLIILEEGSECAYFEGCTAPSFDENQLHAAVVEIVLKGKDSKFQYSTIQNWYAGKENTTLGRNDGGILNLVTKRALLLGENSSMKWVQVEVGANVTWKYPSCVLQGNFSNCEFYSFAKTEGYMQSDTGTKMIHLGKSTRSHIISKAISSDFSRNTYRGLIFLHQTVGSPTRDMSPETREKGKTEQDRSQEETKGSTLQSYTKCDSMLIGDNSTSSTIPVVEIVINEREKRDGILNCSQCSQEKREKGEKLPRSQCSHCVLSPVENNIILEHEATVSRVRSDVLFYFQSRGFDEETAIRLLALGFSKEIFQHLSAEFSQEAYLLLNLRLENTVG